MCGNLKIFQRVIIAVVTIMVATALSSCDPILEEENSFYIGKDSVAYNNTGQFLSITSSQDWSIALEYPSQSSIAAWCNVSPESGSGTKHNIALSYSQNEGDNPREVLIRVTFKNEVIEKRFVQGGKGSSGGGSGGGGTVSDLTSDKINSWLELPKVTVGEGQAYISHYTSIGGKQMRNFSMLYDGNAKIALWIAYPLCSVYMGSQGRSDAWEFDPKIPSGKQPQLYSGFPSMAGVNGYDRGHQIPSADRTANYSTNAQTFYFSNMTPQNSSLNQGVWAKLETMVRGYTSSCDTLYVITGPVLKTTSSQSIEYLYQRGNPSSVLTALPRAYFKVLLKYKISTGKFSSIGFWFDNESYGYDQVSVSDAQTVKEIENRTGLTFFENLPLTETQLATLKNEFSPSSWGI